MKRAAIFYSCLLLISVTVTITFCKKEQHIGVNQAFLGNYIGIDTFIFSGDTTLSANTVAITSGNTDSSVVLNFKGSKLTLIATVSTDSVIVPGQWYHYNLGDVDFFLGTGILNGSQLRLVLTVMYADTTEPNTYEFFTGSK